MKPEAHHPGQGRQSRCQGRHQSRGASLLRLHPTLLALVLLVLPPASHATDTATAWRCTDKQGQVSYSQHPCEGQATQRLARDERTDAQQRQARKGLERDEKLARQMRRQRLREERAASTQRPAALSSTRPHVIDAKANDHKPVPITDMTRPIKMPTPKTGARQRSADGVQAGGTPLHQ